MKVIRKSVFETNSSSMHSLVMIGKDRMGTYNFGESVTVKSNEYGWSGDDLTSPLEKLSYIVTMIQYKDSSGDIAESKYFKWLTEIFKDYTGSELVYQPYDETDKYYKDGYIDHQSTDMLDGQWSDNEEEFKNNMKDIVFNDKYFIIIDNDNH
jgi:hypothetical protein